MNLVPRLCEQIAKKRATNSEEKGLKTISLQGFIGPRLNPACLAFVTIQSWKFLTVVGCWLRLVNDNTFEKQAIYRTGYYTALDNYTQLNTGFLQSRTFPPETRASFKTV